MTAKIHYYDIGDYLDRETKLKKINEFKSIENVEWQIITPNKKHDWINQRKDNFDTFFLIGDKNKKETAIFDVYSCGVATNRDAWCYNFSEKKLTQNIKRMIDFYNEQREKYLEHKNTYENDEQSVDNFIDNDPKKFSWDRASKNRIRRNEIMNFKKLSIMKAMYRPFCKNYLYFGGDFNASPGKNSKIFPSLEFENVMICLEAPGAKKEFSTLITKTLCDLHLFETTQCFPFYVYEDQRSADPSFFGSVDSERIRHENITDAALQKFREHYKDNTITKWDIFYYIYGVLNSREYCERFSSELKKQLPRIPFAKDFREFSKAGKQLAELHLNYENLEPYNLTETRTGTVNYHVTEIRYASKTDKTKIIYNQTLTLENIPEAVQRYIVNGKPALDWILDRYKISTHKDSKITNDPNNWCEEQNNPQYILNLIKRIVTLSVESVQIIENIPKLNLEDKG
ncbi:MAG: hypothetical protein LBP59_12955 [Planctomycetaceae bacterium]|jgi:predicted helicase|nr:hypothetical protein [Planctomycetaceae bacterium]